MSDLQTTDEIIGRRLWAVIMLARTPEVAESILRGLPVRAGNLDGFVLGRALRGAPLPDPDSYLLVTHEQLDAIAEAGPLTPQVKGKQR